MSDGAAVLDAVHRRTTRSAHPQATIGMQEGPITEDWIALEFARNHSRDFRHVHGMGWLRWDGHRWTRDEKKRYFHAARNLVREIAKTTEKGLEAQRLATAKTVAAVLTFAATDPLLVRSVDDFDIDRLSLNTPSGVVDLRTGDVHPHDRDQVTRVTSCGPDRSMRPVMFERFLDDVFEHDQAVIAFVQRLMGYALTGHTREHILAFFHGGGANGKSTLLDLLMWLMGDYALKLPASVLTIAHGERHPTELAQLVGVRLAVASELDEGQLWAEARIKELTGDATLTARFMRADFFTFSLLAKFIVAGNHRPQMRTADDAMRRRMVLIPFLAHFAGNRRDPAMLDKLKAEGPGILAWAIQGCIAWQRDGLEIPTRIREASTEYADTMDSMGLWLADCTVVTRDPTDNERASLLYQSFGGWKQARGEHVMSLTRWGEQMRGRGFESYRNNGVRYRGLSLTPAEHERLIAAASQGGKGVR